MTVDQNKRRSSLKPDQRSMQEVERRLSALEGLAQQTVRYGTKIRGVRQAAVKSTDLLRKGEWTIDGETGNLVVLDADGQLVDSGYSPSDLLGGDGATDNMTAISAYRATAIQEIVDSAWQRVRFNAETYDLQSEFTPAAEWTKVADQHGTETTIWGLVELDGEIYGCTGPSGKLVHWTGSAWEEVADQLGGEDVISLVVFNSKIYGGTGTSGKLYEWNAVDAWVEKAGQLNAQTDIWDLAVYNSKLYGCTGPGGRLFEWNDSNAWVEKAGQLGAETDIYSLCVYGGALYGGTFPNGNLYVWNDVDAWVQKAPQGGSETLIDSLVVYRNELYGGTSPNGNLFQWNGVNAWTQKAAKLGAETRIYSMLVLNDKLYGMTSPGARLFRWNESSAWEEMAAKAGSESIIVSSVSYSNVIYGGSYDSGELYSWDGNSGRFVADAAGRYFIHATIAFTSTNIAANKHIMAAIYKNGSEIARSTLQTAFADEISISVQTEAELTQGSYIELYVWHDMGATCEINYSSEKSHLDIFQLISSNVTIESIVAGGGISNVVEDLTPQLGGDLDLNSKNIDFPSTADISDCLDEDDMASDSATALATQQSIKKYVDDNAGGGQDNLHTWDIIKNPSRLIGLNGDGDPVMPDCEGFWWVDVAGGENIYWDDAANQLLVQ